MRKSWRQILRRSVPDQLATRDHLSRLEASWDARLDRLCRKVEG
ncbi:hypothetical protein [Pelagovum pacificum]|nr:hypothetical protein [Pelagovum pacificum]